MNFVFILFVVSAFGYNISFAKRESSQAIQIISSTNNHSFELKLNELNKLLQVTEIKDRNVVIVSIAGAFRQGKSFLLNFFIKYLYAQVMKLSKLIVDNQSNWNKLFVFFLFHTEKNSTNVEMWPIGWGK